MAEAGESSPHLDQKEQRQAAAGAPMGALVIHEIVRDQGEEELERSFGGLAWSGSRRRPVDRVFVPDPGDVAGTAAGCRLAPTGLRVWLFGRLSDRHPWAAATVHRDHADSGHPSADAAGPAHAPARCYGFGWIVLSANLAATWVFAGIAAIPDVFPPATMQAMAEISAHTMEGPFWRTVLTGGSAGWLIGLMVWLLPSAHTGRAPIIILLTYVIAICQFPHIIAGSAEAAFRVFTGHATVGDYFSLPDTGVPRQRRRGHDLGGTVEPRALGG